MAYECWGCSLCTYRSAMSVPSIFCFSCRPGPRYAFTALGASAFCLSPATSPSRKHICTCPKAWRMNAGVVHYVHICFLLGLVAGERQNADALHSEQPQHSYAMPLDTIYLTRHGVCALCIHLLWECWGCSLCTYMLPTGTRCGGKAECRCAEGGESIPRSVPSIFCFSCRPGPRYAFTALGASAFCLSPATSA
jgi:hypothetical protein